MAMDGQPTDLGATDLGATVLAALPVGITVSHFPTDDPLDGCLVLANAAASAHLGLDLKPTIGNSFRYQIVASGGSLADAVAATDSGLMVSFEVAVQGGSRSFADYEVDDGTADGHYQSTVFGLPGRRAASVFRRVDAEIAATQALDWAMQSIESANVELSKFASTVAHDLKNPLAGISGYAQMLQMQRSQIPEALHELVDRIVELTDLSSGMVDGLLRYAKKPSMIGNDRVDLERVVAWVESIVAEQLREVSGTITCGPLPLVNGNEAALRQVFLNLTSNAIRYRHLDRPLKIEVRSTEQSAVELIDNGQGIADQDRDHVFDWGYRSQSMDHTVGSGMGLAACRSVLLNLGGDITVEIPPAGGGTTMRLFFGEGAT